MCSVVRSNKSFFYFFIFMCLVVRSNKSFFFTFLYLCVWLSEVTKVFFFTFLYLCVWLSEVTNRCLQRHTVGSDKQIKKVNMCA